MFHCHFETLQKSLAQNHRSQNDSETYLNFSMQSMPLGSSSELNAQELEEEAGQEAAFNPETGEINWDCPCLGGMAHGRQLVLAESSE
jgi:hypothetical protein